jgi:hypothetical protein
VLRVGKQIQRSRRTLSLHQFDFGGASKKISDKVFHFIPPACTCCPHPGSTTILVSPLFQNSISTPLGHSPHHCVSEWLAEQKAESTILDFARLQIEMDSLSSVDGSIGRAVNLTVKAHAFTGAILTPKHARELTPPLCLAITSALAEQAYRKDAIPYTSWITEAWRVLGCKFIFCCWCLDPRVFCGVLRDVPE